MTISRKDIMSFENGLYNLRQSIMFFNGKLENCVLRGMIDLTHKIESNIESLDADMSKILNESDTSVEEIRNIRLNDNLIDLKRQYNNIKTEFETKFIFRKI